MPITSPPWELHGPRSNARRKMNLHLRKYATVVVCSELRKQLQQHLQRPQIVSKRWTKLKAKNITSLQITQKHTHTQKTLTTTAATWEKSWSSATTASLLKKTTSSFSKDIFTKTTTRHDTALCKPHYILSSLCVTSTKTNLFIILRDFVLNFINPHSLPAKNQRYQASVKIC